MLSRSDNFNGGLNTYKDAEEIGPNEGTVCLEKPTTENFIVEQYNTPDVLGPSEDGSGSFTSLGEWVPTEYPQSNTWIYTNLDTGAQTSTIDAWTLCDNPPFNITYYY